MKFADAKSLFNLTCGVFLALVIVLGAGKSHAATLTCGSGATCPYIKVYGSDAMAGGWFGSNCSGTASPTLYQSYNSGAQGGNPQSNNDGGILTYAKESGTSAAGGSSEQYGAFALGSIEGASGSDYGFYSGSSTAGGSVSRLSFANSGLPSASGAWGGQFEGGGQGSNCIPDYFAKQNSPHDLGTLSTLDLSTLNAYPQYVVTAAGQSIALTGNLPSNVNTTLFVKGSAYIPGPGGVTYPATFLPTAVPKFALVVQGNIYIDHSVPEIDGFYIAEPSSFSSDPGDGVIWTCHDGTNTTSVLAADLIANCGASLNVEGALVAKQINFLRLKGDVTTATTAEDGASGLSAGLASSNIGEIINYTPAMVIGGPFFNASSSTAIDKLVSLPPVF